MNENKKKSALIVSGDALILMFGNPDLKRKFLDLGLKVNVVVACRVSPK